MHCLPQRWEEVEVRVSDVNDAPVAIQLQTVLPENRVLENAQPGAVVGTSAERAGETTYTLLC